MISAYALHHLSVAEREDLLKSVVVALEPGGWFLNADLLVAEAAAVERRIQEIRVVGVSRRAPDGDEHFSDASSTRRTLDELETRECNQPQTLDTDLRLLREAGLASAEVLWREYREAVIGGPKVGG